MAIKVSLPLRVVLAAFCVAGFAACANRQAAPEALAGGAIPVLAQAGAMPAGEGALPKVYMTTDISPAGLGSQTYELVMAR